MKLKNLLYLIDAGSKVRIIDRKLDLVYEGYCFQAYGDLDIDYFNCVVNHIYLADTYNYAIVIEIE